MDPPLKPDPNLNKGRLHSVVRMFEADDRRLVFGLDEPVGPADVSNSEAVLAQVDIVSSSWSNFARGR